MQINYLYPQSILFFPDQVRRSISCFHKWKAKKTSTLNITDYWSFAGSGMWCGLGCGFWVGVGVGVRPRWGVEPIAYCISFSENLVTLWMKIANAMHVYGLAMQSAMDPTAMALTASLAEIFPSPHRYKWTKLLTWYVTDMKIRKDSISKLSSCWIHFVKHKTIFAFTIIAPNWYDIGNWNPS